MLSFKKRKKGFTLVEVVLSVTILAIIVSPVLSMVLTNVKINKDSEDKQKALYIAQKTIEKQKLDSSIITGTTTSEAIDFKIQKTITELENYKFPDVINNNENNNIEETTTNNTPKTFADISYDAKIDINTDTKDNLIQVNYYDDHSEKKDSEFKLNESQNYLNITNYDGYIIINVNKDSDVEVDKDPNKIVCKKINSSDDKKTGSIIIQSNTDTQPKIEIHGFNNCDEDLICYFATSKEQESNYSLINDGGKIKSYYNIFYADSEHKYRNNSRVYRIDVEVSKNGKTLQKITAFKTVLE